jgi:hypothetical protein
MCDYDLSNISSDAVDARLTAATAQTRVAPSILTSNAGRANAYTIIDVCRVSLVYASKVRYSIGAK